MTFLPIVDRELRENSRRRGTYWLRVRVAFQALLIGLAGYVINLLNPQIKLGTVLFWGLSGVSMIFCLLAGRRSTADCLSQEKREGTLGLLFLTDLKGYDVVLGKLAATSISGFYALMAIFPVLAIPLLAGGMTNGELWRMALVLVNTFFLSLAIGLFASALSRDYRAAMAVNFFLALLLAFAPAACGLGLLALPKQRFVPQLFYSCPIFSFVACGDAPYRANLGPHFWWSLAVTHWLAWMLTLLACWIVPRTWGDKPAPAPSSRWRWRDLGRMISYGSPAKCAAFRKEALEVGAYYWLAGRARLKPAQVWLFLATAAAWWICGRIKAGAYWMDESLFITAGILVNSALKLWIAVEAGQRIGEDRHGGAFELLLATPLTVGDFLRGQILALRRQFLKPLLLVTALELVLILALKRNRSMTSWEILTCVAGVCMLWADALALAWVAMAAALTCKNQTQATSHTVVRILVLPWVALGIIASAINLLNFLDLVHWSTDQAGPGMWFGLGIGADLFFGLRAWHLLRNNFRRLAVRSFLPEPPRWHWWRACWGLACSAVRCVPARARKPVFASLTAGAALMAVFLAHRRGPHYPPPVLVSIAQSNAPLKVFPGSDGVFFVMPDGTLWRWGKTGAPQSPRAIVPEQVGTAHDWVKAVGAGTHCLGLRADGTIWSWGFSNGRYFPKPQPAMLGHDWVDVGTGHHQAAAIKRDGTLWTWNEPLVAGDGNHPPRSLQPGSNWVAVYCSYSSTVALRKDGTLWAGGDIGGMAGGMAMHGTFNFPTLLCAATNWTALDANGVARNQAGELWDISRALPSPQSGAAAVCSLEQTNCVRLSGTDWVASWGHGLTGFGLTADGTVWTWGRELDKEPVKTYASRLEILQSQFSGRYPSAARPAPSVSAQPRPLLKLLGEKAKPSRK